MRRFYAPPENFSRDSVMLDADETRHLRDVLRLTVGDDVSVFEGMGREFGCTIAQIGKKQTTLSVLSETIPSSPESPLDITVAAAVISGEKYDLIIQKAVELGVSSLIPLQTIRSDVKVRDAQKRLGRWRRIALEATKQSGRAKLMQVLEAEAFETCIASVDGASAVLFSERDGEGFATLKAVKQMTAFFGPKGGWDDSELEAAGANGVKVVTLGGRILRAETASIAITAILQHRFGDFN